MNVSNADIFFRKDPIEYNAVYALFAEATIAACKCKKICK